MILVLSLMEFLESVELSKSGYITDFFEIYY